MGCKHEAFEAALRERLGCEVTLFANGHLALEAALEALELPAGGEVITTPFTFVSTTHAIVRRGLRPVFCDVRPEDGTLDPDYLEPLITERTVAVVPVHVYGNVCDTERIGAIAARHGLKVVYDAAHAFGVRCGGIPVETLGDASVLSFHATKVFSTVEGGAVCYRNPALRQRLEDSRNFGIRDKEHCEAVGGNAKLNELQAAMGLCNLRHLEEALSARRALSARYRELLAGHQEVRPFPSEPAASVLSNGAYFPVLFPSQERRDAAYAALEAAGIGARKYFWPLTSDMGCYRGTIDPGHTPVARDLSARILCLPLYPGLTDAQMRRVADCLG
jgi:dTDP-4-amino-4,6-dideoxygalactose transaminase